MSGDVHRDRPQGLFVADTRMLSCWRLAIDGAPVRIVVGVLAPQHHTGDHLRVLARVSRLLRNPEVRESLLSARDAHEAFDIIARADAG